MEKPDWSTEREMFPVGLLSQSSRRECFVMTLGIASSRYIHTYNRQFLISCFSLLAAPWPTYPASTGQEFKGFYTNATCHKNINVFIGNHVTIL